MANTILSESELEACFLNIGKSFKPRKEIIFWLFLERAKKELTKRKNEKNKQKFEGISFIFLEKPLSYGVSEVFSDYDDKLLME